MKKTILGTQNIIQEWRQGTNKYVYTSVILHEEELTLYKQQKIYK